MQRSRMIHSADIGPRLALHPPAVLERSQEKILYGQEMNQNEADSHDTLTVFKDCMLEYSHHTWVIFT